MRTTVGFSGSGASRRALRWAVQDCAATGRALHVVIARGAPAGAGDAESLLAEEFERTGASRPHVEVTVTTEDAPEALLVAAAQSDVLVLGCGRNVAPVGPSGGRVLRVVLPHAPVPVVLVGPQAVLTPTRRLLVVSSTDSSTDDSSADEAVTDCSIERERDVPLRLLTTWQAGSRTAPLSSAGRRHAHLVAAGHHHAVRAELSAAGHRPVRADMVEGTAGEVVPQRLVVGDLVVVRATAVRELPVRTLRSPVVLVPPPQRQVVLPDTAAARGADLREPARSGAARG